MNKTIPHELNPLPLDIEKQLSNLEARHKRHQAMLDEHRERKHRRREAHFARRFINSTPPIVLV